MKKIAYLLVLFLFASCHQANMESQKSYIPDDALEIEEQTNATYANDFEVEVEPPRTAEPPTPPQPDDAKIIRSATLNIEVENYKDTRNQLDNLFQSTNAFVVNEVENDLSHQARNVIKIRVQPNNFFTLVKNIETLAFDVKYKEVKAKDVGEEFVDLETRLATKRAVVKRYREILKSAKNINEILEVEEHIRAVVEEIESDQGRLKYLTNQVNQSTIQLTMFETKPTPVFAKAGFFGRLGDAFTSGWTGLQEVILLLVHFWAFIVVGGIIGFIFFRKRRTANDFKQTEFPS